MNERRPPAQDPVDHDSNAAQSNDERIKINGFGQVLEMLQAADPAFRESLLRRLAQRDPALVRNLRTRLSNH